MEKIKEKLKEVIAEAKENMDYIISGSSIVHENSLLLVEYMEESGLYLQNKEKAFELRNEILEKEKEYNSNFKIGEDIVIDFQRYENDDSIYFDGGSYNETEEEDHFVCYINECLEIIDYSDEKESGFKNNSYEIESLDVDAVGVGKLDTDSYDIFVDNNGNLYRSDNYKNYYEKLRKMTDEEVLEYLKDELECDEEVN